MEPKQGIVSGLFKRSRFTEPGICPRCQTRHKDFELMPAPDGVRDEKWCHNCLAEYVEAQPWPGILGIIT